MEEQDAAPGGTRHATVLVIGTTGVMIEGPSGSGKTTLALALIEAARAEGRFAALVADDRVCLAGRAGRAGRAHHVIARAPAVLAGLVEVPAHGIVARPHLPACRLDRLVRLSEDPALRMAPRSTGTLTLSDGPVIELPCLTVQARRSGIAARSVLSWVAEAAID